MANTYSQVHLHLVFAVKYRAALIRSEWKDELYRYITGIIQKKGHKLLAINGMKDHIHIFIGYHLHELVSDLVRDIKQMSSLWINNNRRTYRKFAWQDGYGVFSYSRSHISNVISYIENQEQHHRKTSFREEYLELLQKFEVEYNEQYVFSEPMEG